MITARRFLVLCCATGALALPACDDDSGGGSVRLESELRYELGAEHLLIVLSRDIGGSETLHGRIRSLAEGDGLDCRSMAPGIPTLTEAGGPRTFTGPAVDASMFAEPTSPETLLGETEESYAARQASTYFVDVCVMDGGAPVHEARYDLRQALDRRGEGGKIDAFDDGVKIVSNQAYAEACISDLGDIPFWGERIGEDGVADWATANCLELGTPIPSTIDGVVQTEHRAPKCDNPQYIYSHCEADASSGANGPRVAHARNKEGTHWVLLCRKSHPTVGRYEDMAMIGHNPFTGQTCFFQNQLPFGLTERPSNDGTKIPHPADNLKSAASPEVWGDMWGGIQGGIGPQGGIQCQGCHSTDPFVHSPWIDGAVDAEGNPLVPKMGKSPDFVEGYNSPYRILDAEDQGWRQPKHLISEEAAACTRCHRIGLDQWTAPSDRTSRNNEDGGCVFCGQAPWINRLERKDSPWDGLLTESHQGFADTFWMPPNAREVLNEELWPESVFRKAISFIRACGVDPAAEGCEWADLPAEPGDPTLLPEVAETGVPLAEAALAILGAPYLKGGVRQEGTRRCAECHATSQVGFKDWLEATDRAVGAGLDLASDPSALTQERALEIVGFARRGNANSVFAAAKIGILAPGVQFSWFQKLFQKAYGPGWGIPYGAFLQRVSMPKGSHPPMSAREFAIVRKWFVVERLANIEELLPEKKPPETCDEVRAEYNLAEPDPLLAKHIGDMEHAGWGALNKEFEIIMQGCPAGGEEQDPIGCFTTATTPEKGEWLSGTVPAQRIVQIRDLGFDTSFWMRSSADGRFVGNGGRGGEHFGATITDLITEKDIGVKGSYDPGFFPNNGGFIMQGGGAGLCAQSVLTRPDAIADGIDFTEAGCSKAQGINLYQHVAVSLNGVDHFIINSEFTSDSGSGGKDPRAPFYEGSTMKFSPLIFTGSEWTQKGAVVVDSPYEGDAVLSPSGKMVISRFAGPDGVALGYMLRQVEATPDGDTNYSIDISTPLRFLCLPGAKANISYDERWMVTHHYEEGTSNLYVSDLLTGDTTKVTNMPAGTKALFPHFRSDGWIYFLKTGEDGDAAMATDAVLRLRAQSDNAGQ